jgi:TIR domain
MTRTKIFISYSHRDGRWLDRVREHLAVLENEGLIDLFDDTGIAVGEDWYSRLDREMLDARLALLLISAPFLGSVFIRTEEVPRLFARHESDGMVLYPLLVLDCAWREVPWLARLQIRPKNARPIASFRSANLDKCLADVAREIAAIVKEEPKMLQDDGISTTLSRSFEDDAEEALAALIPCSITAALNDQKLERMAEKFLLVRDDHSIHEYTLQQVDRLTSTQREKLFAADPEMLAWWRGKSLKTGAWPLFRLKGGIWFSQDHIGPVPIPEKHQDTIWKKIPGLLDWCTEGHVF